MKKKGFLHSTLLKNKRFICFTQSKPLKNTVFAKNSGHKKGLSNKRKASDPYIKRLLQALHFFLVFFNLSF
jgi:hypothetical protein